jgi:excisionase family DNA binding protein
MKQENGQDLPLIREKSDNLNDAKMADSKNCSVCKDLLTNIGWFFDMLETARRSFTSDWLTVDEIAAELKISKSIVYRLIRNGELEAVDLVDTNGKIARKGHYRITRASLNQFLESRKVRPLPKQVTHPSRSRRLPRVKNHLGL